MSILRAINEIIGKKDAVTFQHVVSVGNPSPTPPQEDQEQQSEKHDEEKGDGDDEAIKAKGKAAKQTKISLTTDPAVQRCRFVEWTQPAT